MTDLRDVIARAIFDSDHGDHYPLSRDEIWGDIRGSRTMDEYYANADAVIAVLADHDAKVLAEALREAADAFEGGAINVEVFGDSPEVVYWRAANETRGSIVSSLRARADRIERGEQA